ncbi:MAG: nuclear transport factor 2 family protein [Alphaproteobacteria bacterium]|nr:nuclear transport factor 2 family protein [Alphaproteobacteria bacterium]
MSESAPHPNAALIRRYLAAIEARDIETLTEVLSPDIVQRELPNKLMPEGATRTREKMMEGVERGAKALRSERYEVEDILIDGDRAACRIRWTGVLAVPVLGKEPGDELQAAFGLFLTIRDGQVVEQFNYDCFLP